MRKRGRFLWLFSKIFLLVERLGALVAFRKEKKQKIDLVSRELSHVRKDDLDGMQ